MKLTRAVLLDRIWKKTHLPVLRKSYRILHEYYQVHCHTFTIHTTDNCQNLRACIISFCCSSNGTEQIKLTGLFVSFRIIKHNDRTSNNTQILQSVEYWQFITNIVKNSYGRCKQWILPNSMIGRVKLAFPSAT